MSEDFLKRIANGPAFLLLGQRYLAIERGIDPLLAEFRSKYRITAPSRGYFDLLARGTGDSDETVVAWLDERARRVSIPSWLSTVAQFAWSGVYASAVDSVWPAAFRLPWRDVQPIFDEQYRPSDPRNR